VVEDWKFAASFDAKRRERLMETDSFATVVDLITASANVTAGWICGATDLGISGCWRPVAAVTVSREAFDAFFNSRGGYRAKFLESPEAGQTANGTLLRILEPRLSASVINDCGNEIVPRSKVLRRFELHGCGFT
jgi:hypothetical protein